MTATVVADGLTAAEAERLAELERVVERGLEQFLAVGRSLQSIQSEQLYRATHRSFATYVKERWRLSEARASQLVASSRAADAIGDALPARLSETALRQLVPVLRELGGPAVAEAWAMVIERHTGDAPPTASEIRALLLAAGLPIFGRAPGRGPGPRLDQLAALIANARARVERLQEAQRGRTLDAGEVSRLAGEAREIARLLDGIADPEVDDSHRCECRSPRTDGIGLCTRCRLEIPYRAIDQRRLGSG